MIVKPVIDLLFMPDFEPLFALFVCFLFLLLAFMLGGNHENF